VDPGKAQMVDVYTLPHSRLAVELRAPGPRRAVGRAGSGSEW
jgi:hypothetical protein